MKDGRKFLKTIPFQHQINNLQFHLSKFRSADWSDCGTGKSWIALAKFIMLRQQGLVYSLLIVSPLTVIESWILEIEKHTYLTYTVLTGSLERKLNLLNNRTDVYIIAYDAISGRRGSTLGILLEKLVNKHFGMVILDEATNVQNFSTLRSKALEVLCDHVKYVLGLSGTPVTNDPTKILTLYRVIDKGETFGKNIFKARNRYFQNVGWTFPKYVIRKEMEEEFKNRLFQNAVRIRKEECLDLPPKIWTPRFGHLSGEAMDIYNMIANGVLRYMETEEGTIKISNILTQLAKLSQITSGFIYTDKGEKSFVENPKLELLLNFVQELPVDEKIVIYSWWKKDIYNIAQALENLGYKTERLSGDTPQTARKAIIDSFQNDKKVKAFISNPAAGGFGLTLTAACYIIYYSLSFSLIHFKQSQDRIHRIGQKSESCFYYPLLLKDTIDEYIFESLQNGVRLASSLTDATNWNRLKNNLKRANGKN